MQISEQSTQILRPKKDLDPCIPHISISRHLSQLQYGAQHSGITLEFVIVEFAESPSSAVAGLWESQPPVSERSRHSSLRGGDGSLRVLP